jgi:hypothetical protein
MRSLYLAIQSRCSRFDIDMPYTEIFDMPVEMSLELVPSIGSDCVYAERELSKNVVYEIYNVFLSMLPVDLE